HEPDKKPSAVELAKERIHTYLAHGPAPADDMDQARKILGIAEQTWKQAKAELGVHSHKIAKVWFWFLPPCQYCDAKQQPAPSVPLVSLVPFNSLNTSAPAKAEGTPLPHAGQDTEPSQESKKTKETKEAKGIKKTNTTKKTKKTKK